MKNTGYFLLFIFLLAGNLGINAQSKIVGASINTTPAGATVIISGQNYNNLTLSTPTKQNFRAGLQYTLTFSLPGYENKTITYTGGSGDINITLVQNNYLTLKIPSGSQVFINNVQQQVSFGSGESWKTFTFYSQGGTTATVRVVYYGVTAEKTLNFNRGSYSFFSDIR